MNKWSGLAPAVDAHLSRWGVSRRGYEISDPLFVGASDHQLRRHLDDEVEGITRRALDRLYANDSAMRWLTFCRSYGLPDDDGKPAPAIHVRDRADGDKTLDLRDGSTISGREQFTDTGESIIQGLLMIRREYEMLNQAVTHYVSAEVCEEITWAAEEMPPEMLFESDLFTPAGFAVLEHPLAVVDLNIDTGLPDPRVHIHIRAIGWHQHSGIMSPVDQTVGDGVTLFLYTTPTDYRNGYLTELAATGVDRDAVWASEADVDGPFLPVEVIPWRFGAPWVAKPDNVIRHIPGTVPSPVAFQRRWFLAFMRLCWQEIIVHRPEHQPRQMLRKWARAANRKALLDYTTLRLRRVVDPDYVASGTGTPLDHRVKVRGHKKRQWYPSLGDARLPDGSINPESHKLIWVDAHIRGPEDGPMGAWHPATSFVR